jgi:hypothetical protein
MAGALSTKVGAAKFMPRVTGQVLRVWLTLGTSGSGTTTVDVNLNGTTMFGGTKPNLASAETVSSVFTPASPAFDADDYLSVDVDAVGPGAGDLLIHLEFEDTP